MPDPRTWHRILNTEDIGDVVKVEVSYYSETHRRKIRKSLPSRKGHLPEHDEVITIPASEFLTYWLFEDKDENDPLSCSYEVLSKSVQDTLPDLKRQFEHSEGDVRALAKKKGTERPGDISTRLGVCVGLAVTNRLLGLTRADWSKVEKTYAKKRKNSKKATEEKRMDYFLTTTENIYVALENKGSILNNNRLKAGLQAHVESIKAKKVSIRKKQKAQPLIGAIAVADSRDDSTLKCWLLDPPQDLPTDLDPVLFRVIARLSYYGGLLRCVFPRWHGLHRALKQRIQSLRKTGNWQGYSGMPLRYPMEQLIRANWKGESKPQAWSGNGLWAGLVKPCGSDHLLFAGVSEKWVELVLKQDLSRLLEIESKAVSEKVLLQWQAPKRDLKMLFKTNAKIQQVEDSNRYQVDLPVTLHQSSSGFAFALIENQPSQTK
jgi:hypothetical protein